MNTTALTRREAVVKAFAVAASGLVAGCGGGGGNASAVTAPAPGPSEPPAPTPAPTPGPPGPTPAPTPRPPFPPQPPTLPTGRYRPNQLKLFQAVPAATLPARIAGSAAFNLEVWGPTFEYVSFSSGWSWDEPGGDWIDALQNRYGTVPWFSVNTNAVLGENAIAPYLVDVTDALRFVQSSNRWCAFWLRCPNAPRRIAGTTHPTQPAPYIDVRYTDGSTARLACSMVADANSGSTLPLTTAPGVRLRAFLEFDRPSKPVASASMHFVVVEHWSGSNPPAVEGFLLDPPVNVDPVRQGTAAAAARLDEGLASNPAVFGVHRYLDGTSRDQFFLDDPINTAAGREYDPAIFGVGPSDISKLPHRGLGKWIGAGQNWELVTSSERRDGFQPLAPGVGAVRISMPGDRSLTDGSIVGYGGTLAGNGFIFLPEPLFGRQQRLFVRHYFRLGTPLGTPYRSPLNRRLNVYKDDARTVATWIDKAGKFGIMPHHLTAYGGVSGSSGGGAGWCMRMSWSDCDAEQNGPEEAGWTPGMHLYDFYWRNPTGYNYVNDSRKQMSLGQRGGLGSVLYADHWYCLEVEMKLNTVSPSPPGFTPDGELRTWIDGRLTYQRTGMVFRTLPTLDIDYDPDFVRPCRELGHKGLWLDWFHGGTTPNSVDRSIYITGLAWGSEYIGPMKI